jgi:hypothetical protein
MSFKFLRRKQRAYGMFDLEKATWVGTAEMAWPLKGRGPRAEHVRRGHARMARIRAEMARQQEEQTD